jgi:hypothetical protein
MTTLSAKEFTAYRKRLESFAAKVKRENRNSSVPLPSKTGIQILKSAGVLTKSGRISQHYKSA